MMMEEKTNMVKLVMEHRRRYSSPVPIQLDSGVTATGITSGDHFKCATASDGSIQCWGYNGNSNSEMVHKNLVHIHKL